jgi:hypothetical protein
MHKTLHCLCVDFFVCGARFVVGEFVRSYDIC